MFRRFPGPWDRSGFDLSLTTEFDEIRAAVNSTGRYVGQLALHAQWPEVATVTVEKTT